MAELGVSLGALALKNPVIPASGTFGYGEEFAEFYDLNLLGAVCVKGTTLHPRFGNPTPRVAECASGMLNAIGLQNPGVDQVIARELPNLAVRFSGPIVVNVGGFSIDEYAEVCRRLDGCAQATAIELNISCPNVRHGGMSFGTDRSQAAAVTRAARRATGKPLFVKLSPNVTDVADMARAVEAEGADGLSLINTLVGMRIDVAKRRPLLANGTGGLSGPAVFPVALAMVYRVAAAVRVPLIGIGGVAAARDVIEMMMAGATAVQVGTQNLIEPMACAGIVAAL
ncbi:MAG: dihydroorotate dehydrogenase, partial [Clostridiales bacterium]|nr:dihydroorotate dehydrogenase [Clostridiales bacterium]